eukprot:s1318_g7.t1
MFPFHPLRIHCCDFQWRQVSFRPGLYLPGLAEFCLASLKTFQWPCAANVYASPADLEVSVPCHTDRQDVLVFQATGQKRWQVFHPPDIGDVDPLRRGKDGDVIEHLGDPLLDVVLEPGDILYVPLGFGHQTSTSGLSGPSWHITLNLDSVIWGLSYRLLWSASQRYARLRRGERDEAVCLGSSTALCKQLFPWALSVKDGDGSPVDAEINQKWGSGYECLEPPEDVQQLSTELLERAQIWHGKACDDVLPEDVHQAFQMLLEHRQRLLSLHQLMYAEAMLGLGEDPQTREAAHWSALQAEMQLLRTNMGWERGLPFSSTVQDVVEFFQGYNVEPEHVILLQADGKPRGMLLKADP